MTLLNDEMVEKAARAIFETASELAHCPEWDKAGATIKSDFRREARAALETVLPDVVGKCCKTIRKEAEAHLGDIREGDEEGARMVKHAVGCLLTVEEDIRSLLGKGE